MLVRVPVAVTDPVCVTAGAVGVGVPVALLVCDRVAVCVAVSVGVWLPVTEGLAV